MVFIPGDGKTVDEHPEWEAPYETLYITPEGEIYGFVGVDGRIYLDETIIKPEHPIHEYTHLWDRVIAQKNPELWKRGIALMKKTSLWEKGAKVPDPYAPITTTPNNALFILTPLLHSR